MRFKTFLLLLLLVFMVAACVWFYEENKAALQVSVDLFGWETSAGIAMLLAFMAGLASLLPVWIWRDIQSATERWRHRRELREQAQVEEAYRAGASAVANKRRAEAEKAFRAILDRRPHHRDALVALGVVLREQGRHEEAAECHRKAVRLNEDDLEAHYALAEDLEAVGDLPAAEAVYRKIVELRPKRSVAAHERLRDLYIGQGIWEKALEIQGRLEKLPMKDPARRERIGRARLGIEYEVARVRMADRDFKHAVSRLKKILKDEPAFTPAYVALSEAARKQDRFDEGVKWLREGFAETGSPVFLARLEEQFLSRQDPAAAISTFRDLAESRRSDVLPRFFLGRLFTRLEMIEDAADVFSELRGELPDSPTVSYYVARIQEKRGEHAEACELYRSVIQATEGLRMWYRCTGCGTEVMGWQARCDECRAWDTFLVEWMEPTSPSELDVGEVRPVWGAAPDVAPEAAGAA